MQALIDACSASGLLLPWLLAAVSISPAAAAGAPTLAQARQQTAALSFPFEANQGQFDPAVAYAARTFAGTLFVTRDGRIVHALAGRAADVAASADAERDAAGAPAAADQAAARGAGWTLVETLDSAAVAAPIGIDPSAIRVSRFDGIDAGRWQPDIATFDRVQLGQPWPGIAVELAARGANVEKLFTVSPGTDPQAIRLQIDGAQGLRLGEDGSLIAATGNGEVAFTPPIAFQQIEGRRRDVPVRYVLLADDGYRFETGAYDPSRPLVIDPLLRSTYLGGSGFDQILAIATDGGGNAFVAGQTISINFPGTTGGAQPTNAGGSVDAFVARLSSDLGTLNRATYLGGSNTDLARALALDGSGNVFVAGFSSSTNFPGTAGGAQPGNASGNDAFVARLSNDLSTLSRATYLGGSGSDIANALALDGSGHVVVAGQTNSTNFPGTAGGARPSLAGGNDAFVARLSDDLVTLSRATYLGGSNTNLAYTLVLDGSGSVFVAGYTNSINLPGTTGGARPVNAGAGDAFVARLSSDLSVLGRATYLGGSGYDQASALARDGNGNVFVAGYTGSADFPGTSGGAQPSRNSGNDAFVARLSNDLGTLGRATYLGGGGSDAANALLLDGNGDVFVAGLAQSTDFPGTTGGAQPGNAGGNDAFVARLSNDLGTLGRATYLGGSNNDQANALTLDGGGQVLVAGVTESTNFPGTTGSARPNNAGGSDGFIARLTPDLLAVSPTFTVSATAGAGGSASPATQSVTSGSTTTVTLTPDAGFRIAGAIGCSGTLSGNIFSTGVVTADCTVTASSAPIIYTVAAAASAGGSVGPPMQMVASGSIATFIVTPDVGFAIGSVSGCGAGTLAGSTYTTGAITANCIVSASFNAITYTVSATAGANGSVTPATQTVASGNVATLTVTPDAGYAASASGCGGTLSGSTFTTSAVTAHCTVMATFTAITHTVSATAGANGSVTPATQTVASGGTGTVTVTPSAGFMIGSVTGCGAGTLSGDTFTTGAVTANCSVSATFTAVPPPQPLPQSVTAPATPAFVAGSTFALPAAANSGLAVTYASTTPAVCTVSGNTVAQVTAGTCSITASNAGNATFAPLSQTLSFVLVAAAAGGTVIGIPTLSEWGLIVLAMLLAGFVWVQEQRRRRDRHHGGA